MGKEQPAAWYDEAYRTSDGYSQSEHDAPWAPLWRAVSRMIDHRDIVLDIGCGPGHLAQHLAGQVLAYTGIDFSAVAIQQARARVPWATWLCADVETCAWPGATRYLFLEVLEHVERDVELLSRVPIGRRVIVSVPNFDADSHVRHFKSGVEVLERYGHLLEGARVSELKAGMGRSAWFILEGTRR